MFFSACGPSHQHDVDRLNDISYSFHYRNIDSTAAYAAKALALSSGYSSGKAEAMNHLAFAAIMQMDYQRAYNLLDSVERVTDNQIEQLIADVQLMRLCQRESHNKEFYDYHERATRRISRIQEEAGELSAHSRRRLAYARSEFSIVTSTYYYYVGLEQPSIDALHGIAPDGEIRTDTAQMLAYYYNVGSGGIITQGHHQDIVQQEFDYLMRCYLLARQYHYVFWEANSLQAMSEHLQSPGDRELLIGNNLPAMKYLNPDYMPDSLLAGNMAQRSLDMFQAYGDVYQTAGSYRTLAQCYWYIGDYQSAIACLEDALTLNQAIEQAPDLVASIREQLSVAYSAIDDKPKSDYNRNIYLDLQDETRQDRYLESRADQLARSSLLLNGMLAAVMALIAIVIVLLFVFDRLRKRNDRQHPLEKLLEPLRQWKGQNEKSVADLQERQEEIQEASQLSQLHLVANKKRNLEQRTKVSLANSIIPFIDRILNEIARLKQPGEQADVRAERYAYIVELTDQINDYNDVLTQWIQMRQGELTLHIESFPLQGLFDIVLHGRTSFQLKGVELQVEPTAAIVKADRVLTLFMLNTIADNARKFTAPGGRVTIAAAEHDKHVEISISDTGKGMTREELAGIFERKVYNGHGFGLMNCKGIIEKYKKLSPIFSVCQLSAESTTGRGSRFFFRLPKGVVRLLLLLFLPLSSCLAQPARDWLASATAYADSAYYSNIAGTYERTLSYADSCMACLNRHHQTRYPDDSNLLVSQGNGSRVPAEIQWFHAGMATDYHVILDMRNECAVAALALHRWSLYQYNNKAYTQLFKETSADDSLGEYCRVMQRSEANKNVAIALLVILLLSIVPAYYFIYYRHRVFYRFCVERLQKMNDVLLSNQPAEDRLASIRSMTSDRFPEELQTIVHQIIEALENAIAVYKTSQSNIEQAEDELHRVQYEDGRLHVCNSVLDNCLSALKHETMYYPSRIRQLVGGADKNLPAIGELAAYYKELCLILSMQAQRQIETVRISCKPVAVSDLLPVSSDLVLLGDRDLLAELFGILAHETGADLRDITVGQHGRQYIELSVPLPGQHLTAQQCLELFTPSVAHLPYLLCRQIVRDHGEATNLRACGMRAETDANGTKMMITLARTWRNSK